MENNEYLKSLDDAVKGTPFMNTLEVLDDEPRVAVPMKDYDRFIYNEILLGLIARASKELYKDEITKFLLKCVPNRDCEVKDDA